jgi:predicted phosphodiesterase
MTRIALLSDIHGNVLALEAVTKQIRRERPDAAPDAGDPDLTGPHPTGAVDAPRVLESYGALIL